MLPAAGPADGGGCAGGEPADLADEGPGGRGQRQRVEGGLPQQLPGCGVPARGYQGPAGGRAGPALHLARAFRAGGFRGFPQDLPPLLRGHRRGALHFGVGPRFPARLPGPGQADRAFPGAAGGRLHRHRDLPRAAGHHHPAEAARSAAGTRVLQPAQPVLPGEGKEPAAGPDPGLCATASGRIGHRLPHHPGQRGGDGGPPGGPRDQGLALPRGLGGRRARGQPGGVQPR